MTQFFIVMIYVDFKVMQLEVVMQYPIYLVNIICPLLSELKF